MSTAMPETALSTEITATENTMELRHSSRLRKPSRRAVEEMETSKVEENTETMDVKQSDGRNQSGPVESKKDEDVFCVCRKGDDGKPMVLCAECEEWFHFKCVGLTKKAAESLTEFTCPSCLEKKKIPLSEKIESVDSKTDEQSQTSPVETQIISPKRKLQEADSASKRARPQQKDSSSSPHSMTVKASPPVPSPTSGLQTSRKLSSSGPGPAISSSKSHNTSAITAQRVRSENLRKHAEQQLAIIFHEILSELNEEPDEKLKSKSQSYANTFEEALFESTKELAAGSSLHVAGKTYRDRLRSFLFNLKDKTNKSLRTRISDGSLTAVELSTLSNEELANDEIRKEVERRKKENLEQSILKKDKAPLRKLTHKGEIDIEYENRQDNRMVEDAPNQSDSRSRQEVPSKKEVLTTESSDQVKEKSPSSLPALPDSNTFSDAQRRISQSIQSPTLPFDFTSVWQGDQDSNEKEGEDGKSEVGAGSIDETNEEEPTHDDEGNNTHFEEETAERADDFIDNFLGMDEEEGNNAAATNQSDQIKDEKPKIGWQGSINMPDEGFFTCSVRQIAGRVLEGQEWTNLFPSQFALIEGRLPSRSAIPYLLESRIAARTELVAFIAEPEFVKDSVPDKNKITNESENDAAFHHLLHYFTNKDRYGVLQPLRSARGQTVKDFYMASLPKGQEIPEWLSLLSPRFLTEAMSSSRQQDLFLLVAVLFRQNVTTNPDRPPQGTPSSEKDTTPTQSTNPLLAAGSTTLQDLLRAVGGQARNGSNQTPPNVGGGGTPSTPLHFGSQGYQQSQTSLQGRTNEDGLVPASSVQALSELPKPQLEHVLTKNPNLVEDLLRTLSKTSANSINSNVPPPGPPPPRPPAIAFGTSSGQAGYNGGTMPQGYVDQGMPDQQYYGNYPRYGQEYNNNNQQYHQNDANSYGNRQGFDQGSRHSHNQQQGGHQEGRNSHHRGGRKGRW